LKAALDGNILLKFSSALNSGIMFGLSKKKRKENRPFRVTKKTKHTETVLIKVMKKNTKVNCPFRIIKK
jgi:hypothetical protein